MRYLTSFIFLLNLLFFSGCQENRSQHNRIHLLNPPQTTQKTGVNPNSLAYKSADQALERENRLKLSKIEAQARVEIEKIKSQNKLNIAKINAEAQKRVAETDLKAKVQTSQIDAKTHKETIQYTVYIVIVIVLLVLAVFILLYLNAKKNRELKKQLHDEQLRHEQFLKEKELEEQRVHKLLELIASGKVAKNVEKEVILSIAKPKPKGEDILVEEKD
jgi:large-conductance mechanosensitive channel